MGLYVRIRKTPLCAAEGVLDTHVHGPSCIGEVKIASDSKYKNGPPAQHNFSTKWVNRMALTGVVTLSVTLSAAMLSVGGYDYKIVRKPGAYCCHCKERIGDGPARTKDEAALRMAYIGTCEIAGNDDDTGDSSNPAGYEVIDFYDGELV